MKATALELVDSKGYLRALPEVKRRIKRSEAKVRLSAVVPKQVWFLLLIAMLGFGILFALFLMAFIRTRDSFYLQTAIAMSLCAGSVYYMEFNTWLRIMAYEYKIGIRRAELIGDDRMKYVFKMKRPVYGKEHITVTVNADSPDKAKSKLSEFVNDASNWELVGRNVGEMGG